MKGERITMTTTKMTAGRLLTAGLLLIGLLVPRGAEAAPRQGPTQIQKAKDLTMQGEWKQALPLFRQAATARGERADEASFYVGFCLENMENMEVQAFEAYEAMRKEYPDSPMARRALLRQVTLAGSMGGPGTTYREFLATHVKAKDDEIRRQAGLSLGRFGDDRAVPVLKEILKEGSADDKMMVLNLVGNYPEKTANALVASVASARRANIEDPLVKQAEKISESLKASSASSQRTDDLLTRDKRYLMETIKRKGENWTEAELITHGLFHVMKPEMFASYVQADEAGRERIMNEYFDLLGDPVPSTPEVNELKEEFIRRVHQAYEMYSEPWRATRSQFDAKEWLTPDNPYSPWDARGELLIRYGAPTDKHLVGFNMEEWVYSRLRVDFTVHLYMLNYMRNAIYPGRGSQQDYAAGYVQANYIDVPRMEYGPGGIRP